MNATLSMLATAALAADSTVAAIEEGKDFGPGYSYPVLVEDASLTVE